ncbi:MAG: OsmC family protein [Thermoplasmata archaeon]
MSWNYKSLTKWTDEEGKHSEMEMESGYSCSFHKPKEFGGVKNMLNPEDAFVGSLAMCFSITFKEMIDKMRLNIDDFELETEGILEDVDKGKKFTKIYLRPNITSDEPEKKIKKAIKLAKDNCLIANSMDCEIIVE